MGSDDGGAVVGALAGRRCGGRGCVYGDRGGDVPDFCRQDWMAVGAGGFAGVQPGCRRAGCSCSNRGATKLPPGCDGFESRAAHPDRDGAAARPDSVRSSRAGHRYPGGHYQLGLSAPRGPVAKDGEMVAARGLHGGCGPGVHRPQHTCGSAVSVDLALVRFPGPPPPLGKRGSSQPP